jgi:alkylresorcinol/alkylpyrone synthase
MPYVAAVSKIDFPFRVRQNKVKDHALQLFAPSFPGIERLMPVFDNTDIETRNFCKPLSYYGLPHSFEEQNKDYSDITCTYAIRAIEDCLSKAQTDKDSVTDIFFVSSTGLATPSIDALIINRMHLNERIRRTPVFGLGCAGGVSGFAKAAMVARADPDAVVLLVAAELCSLTFLRSDFSKSNLVGSSLFADGIAACLIKGDRQQNKGVAFQAAQSRLYYNTLDIMGWDFRSDGFKVLFSQDIPSLVRNHIREDVDYFLAQHKLTVKDISNFIFHPGGKKVLDAYREALSDVDDENFLDHTAAVIRDNGNMSAPTVLYVLERFLSRDYKKGYGLMLAMGPGFSSEMVLLNMHQ